MKFEKNNKKDGKFLRFLEGTVLTILIVSFGVLIYCIYVSINMDTTDLERDTYKTELLSSNIDFDDKDESENLSNMIERVSNSVVGISKLKNKGTTIFLEDSSTSLGLGTGIIVTENGFIVTNEHVSGEKYDTCYVTLITGVTYTASVVWSDSDIDLSIIKINAKNLDFLELGDSDNLKVAQQVYAIGNPIGFEFQRTVTSGIISGLERTLKIEENDETYYMEGLIQTDATINPGNSGGPLINTKGEVIGINSVKITDAEGIGFASPINIIKPIIEAYKNDGEYIPATLGIFAYDKNIIPYIDKALGNSPNFKNGIYVAKVNKNSPADKAGIKEGDILLKIDDIELSKMSELRQYIYSKKPGDIVKIIYYRNNRQNDMEVILSKKY